MKRFFACWLLSVFLFPIISGLSQEENAMFEPETDITWQLQNAIRSAAKGDEILLPPGLYYVSSKISVRSDISIKGAGMGQTILQIAEKGITSLFSLDEKENVSISGFTVEGRGADAGNIITAEDCREIHIQDVEIKNIESIKNPIAIHFEKTRDSSIRECRFENISLQSEWGCAVRLSHDSSHVTVDGCVIQNTGRGGILCDNGSEYLTIINNVVSGSGITSEGLSIELWGRCGHSVVEDNRVDRWLSLDNAPYTALRRNVISNRIWDRIGFIGIETVGSCNVVITDCVVDEGVYTGLSASNTDPKEYVYWGNVEVRGCAQWGAQFQGEKGWCRYQYFYNLTIENTLNDHSPIYPNDAGHGFRFNDFCEHFVFENCLLKCNTGYDLQLLGTVNDIRFIHVESMDNGRTNRRAARNFTKDITLAQAEFTCPEEVRAGEAVQFENLSPDVSHCLWDFGDGIPTDQMSPTHTYAVPGVYNVTLIVWDENGVGGRMARTIHVAE